MVQQCQVQFGEETVLQTVEVPQLQFSLVIVQILDKAVAAPSLCNDREVVQTMQVAVWSSVVSLNGGFRNFLRFVRESEPGS